MTRKLHGLRSPILTFKLPPNVIRSLNWTGCDATLPVATDHTLSFYF